MKKTIGFNLGLLVFLVYPQAKANLQALGMALNTNAKKEVIGFIAAQLPYIPETTKKHAKDIGYDLDVLIPEAKKAAGGFKFPADIEGNAPQELDYIAEKLVKPAVKAVRDSNDPRAENAIQAFKKSAEDA